MTWFGQLRQWLMTALSSSGWEWGVAAFLITFVGSLILAIAVVVHWRPDQFSPHRPPFWNGRHPVLRALGFVAKNVLGLVLLALGLLMSVPGVPGQGLLTIVIGLTMVDFPGKRPLECWAIRHPRVLRAVNRLRWRFHRPPLEMEPR